MVCASVREDNPRALPYSNLLIAPACFFTLCIVARNLTLNTGSRRKVHLHIRIDSALCMYCNAYFGP